MVNAGSTTAQQESPADRAAQASFEAYTVFAKPGGTQASAGERSRLAAGTGQADEVDLGRVRKVRADAKHVVLVAPSHGDVCIGVEESSGSGSVGCGRPSPDAERALVSTSKIDGGYRVTGLIADGVDVVRVDAAAVRVVDNVFDIATSAAPEVVAWTSPAGRDVVLRPGH